ncbi:MAG TPA: hypothetical protein VJV78_46790 [Polyangiales bacterium]|nr:hypothetical protein [Polyangiales bacterium]
MFQAGWVSILPALLLAGGCTDPQTRTRFDVMVDADSAVRAEVADVDVRVEARQGKSGGRS